MIDPANLQRCIREAKTFQTRHPIRVEFEVSEDGLVVVATAAQVFATEWARTHREIIGRQVVTWAEFGDATVNPLNAAVVAVFAFVTKKAREAGFTTGP